MATIKYVILTAAAALVLTKGAADGTCYGQEVRPIWGASVDVKHGDTWKWTFGINLPAPSKGA
jgi:hypothetical protein